MSEIEKLKYQVKEKIMNVKKNFPWTALVFSILALMVLGVILKCGFGLDALADKCKEMPEIVLPILVMVGAICLLASLAFVAFGFSALGLSDRKFALSLPEGSVRALIALLLLSLFVITAIHLYNRLRFPFVDSRVTKYKGLSKTEIEELTEMPKDQIISISVRTVGEEPNQKNLYDIERMIPGYEVTQESKRFAQQILTSVSTLVIAVAGFYFGTRSVAVARGAVQLKPAVIDSIDPSEGKQGETNMDIEIFGKNLGHTKTVQLVAAGSKEMNLKVIKCSATRIECKLDIPKDQKTENSYSLILVDEDGEEALKPTAFEVVK